MSTYPDKYVHTTQMDDSEVVEKILGDLQRALADKDEDFVRCERYLAMYLAQDPPDSVIDERTGKISDQRAMYSNTYLPVGAAAVDAGVVQIHNQLFGTPRFFSLEGDDWQDDIRAYRNEAHIYKRLREMRFKSMVYGVLQEALCFDYGVTGDRWLTRPGYVNKVQNEVEPQTYGSMTVLTKRKKVKQEWSATAVDRSDVFKIHYFNCAHDTGSRNGFEDSAFFIDWYRLPIWEFKLQAQSQEAPWGRYQNVNAVLEKQQEIMSMRSNIERDPARGTRREQDRLLIVRYWTHDEIIEVCNEIVVSRNKIDGMPLHLWKAYLIPGQFKGMGILQRIERLQYDINAIINVKRDFQNLMLTPITGATRDIGGLEEGDLELYPGRTIWGDGNMRDKLVFYQPAGNPTQGATEELGIQVEMVQRTTGFNENSQGDYTSGRKTARETSAVAAGLLTRVTSMAMRLEEQCLEPTYMNLFKLEQMNLTERETFKYHGEDGVDWLTINPEDYAWNAQPRFEAKGATHAAYQDMYIAQFLKAIEIAKLFPQMHNWENIMSKLWQLLDPHDYRNFIRDPRDRTHDVPPNIENLLFAMGHQVEISPENDDSAHLAVHLPLIKEPDYDTWPASRKMAFEQHIAMHKQREQQKAMAKGAMPTMGFQDSSDAARGQRMTEVA